MVKCFQLICVIYLGKILYEKIIIQCLMNMLTREKFPVLVVNLRDKIHSLSFQLIF